MSVLRSKIFRLAALTLLAFAVAAGIFLYNIFYGANTFDVEKKSFYVSKEEPWSRIVDSLSAKGIIRSRDWFDVVVRLYRKGTTANVGKYEFKSGISNAAVYHSLIFGRNIVPINVPLKEGRRMAHYGRALHRTVGIDTVKFLRLVNDETFTRSLGVNATNLEGYLFPNTYAFNWRADEEDVIKRLVQQTARQFTDSMQVRMKELRMSIHQVLTLASIIEGEAFLDDERPTISGVYHNRLRKGIRLEADPTIQFLLSNGPRRILFRDLEIRSPYNTYMNIGLPPGPICNPRHASIMAALYPEKHGFLFFVANGKGGHWFARDYAGHMNNVRKFKRERAAQIRSMNASAQKKLRGARNAHITTHHPHHHLHFERPDFSVYCCVQLL